jgi:hypothetical protein
MSVRFVNLNPFPVYIPSKGNSGTSDLFRPNEFSTDQWFSRFCGPKMLSKVDDGTPSPPPAVRTPLPAAKVPGIVQEETRFYARKSGIYICKLCDLFQTGSRIAFGVHLREAHRIDSMEATSTVDEPKGKAPIVRVQEVVAPTPEPAPAPVPEPAVAPVAAPEPNPPTEPTAPPASPEAPPEALPEAPPEAPAESHACPLCPKEFKSARGLQVHTSRMHKSA